MQSPARYDRLRDAGAVLAAAEAHRLGNPSSVIDCAPSDEGYQRMLDQRTTIDRVQREPMLGPANALPRIVPGAEWPAVYARARALVPDAFGDDGQILNLVAGAWGYPGRGKLFTSPCDGTPLCIFPLLEPEAVRHAVRSAAAEHQVWSTVDLDERRRRVAACVALLRAHRELLAYLLTWEIGKPFTQALSSVDRCVSGVEWYIDQIETMLEGRRPLGLISNIASWNYPLSVLVHGMLVQVLVGNAVIAKSPSDGGLCALTLSLGLARQCGLPVSLVSGPGAQLSEVLIHAPEVACLCFVGGRINGRDIAANLYTSQKRYMLEMEGINAYGIWQYSDWPALAKQIKKGFEYGKQRCTAYPRYVIQRRLFPRFLDIYLSVVDSLRVGHPLLATEAPSGESITPPLLDFGPLISGRQVHQLRGSYDQALARGAISLYEGTIDPSLVFPGQDLSTYLAPAALTNVPRSCALYHSEPFGPIDTLVVVDSVDELIAEINVSGGSLVASIACDDTSLAGVLASQIRAFKIGINATRSRGDREETFGGSGESWKGCFVGGKYLVEAVTAGPVGERLHGNFPAYTLLPEQHYAGAAR